MSYFKNTDYFIDSNPNLRKPQRIAHHRLTNYFKSDDWTIEKIPPIVVLPTGTGKTGLIAISPYGIADKKVLIVAPNLIIYDGIVDKLNPVDEENFFLKRGVILDHRELPIVVQYESRFKRHLLDRANFIVTNIQKTYGQHENSLVNTVPEDYFDLIIFDEAHHCPATTYQELSDYFSNAKIIKTTGTPFRADRKDLYGNIIYNYSLGEAMLNKYIKVLGNKHYIPEKLTFTIENEEKTFTMEELFETLENEQQMLSRGVAYSIECSKSVVEKSIDLLNEKREISKHPHKIIAVACSIKHAEQIKDLYNEYDISATIIHSELSPEVNQINKNRFENDLHQVIINVGKLGEGYDHKYISIAAIFRPFRTLSPYIQFVGRTLRIIPNSDNYLVDNTALVVYHKGLCIDELWDYFKKEKQKALTTRDLKEFVDELTDDESKNNDKNNNKKNIEVVNQSEGYYGDDSFLDSIDIIANYEKAVKEFSDEIQEKLNKVESAGIELSDEMKKIIENDFIKTKRKERLKEKRPELVWKEKDEYLNELIYDETPKIIEDLDYDPKGTELLSDVEPKYYWILKSLGENATNAAYYAMKINKILKESIGKSRKNGNWSIEELDAAIDKVERIHEKLYNEYKDTN